MAGKQVVKVWIETGCIVCDACETTCPEIFHVQSESCTIRPEALEMEFLKPRSQTILQAVEECPVEVIKIEVVKPDVKEGA